MEDTEKVTPDTLNGEGENQSPEKTDNQSTQQKQEKKSPDEVDKLKELVSNYKIRAEKAEAALKKEKASTSETQLSVKDLTSLVKANVNEDDYDDIFTYAKIKNISVAEALKTPLIKTMLAEKEEMRKTAENTSTGKNTPGPSIPSSDELLRNAREKGELPNNEEAIQKIVEARLKRKTH